MKNKINILPIIITIIASIGVGVNIMLSEILYPDIEDFFKTPFYYQLLMYISLIILVIGFILSFIYKRNKFKYEKIIELCLIIIGIPLMFIPALVRFESFILDLLLCTGGALFFIGLFTLISTTISSMCFNKEKNK